MNETKKMVDFVINLRYEDLPEAAIEKTKQCILDGVGVIFAAMDDPIAAIMGSYLREAGGPGLSSVIGLGLKTSPASAALGNGTLCHALDFDDFCLPALSHPTTTIMPAALAMAEYVGASGKDAILAFNAGYEIFCKVAGAMNPSHWYKGFHATGTFGTYGAVAAASKLLKLDEDQTTRAFGIASSLAAGLKQNIGTHTKPLHAGHAAENGIRAALLAQKGFTAANDAFEGRMGLARLMSDEQDFSVLDKIADPLEIIDPAPFIKPHPSCGGTHASMNAMLYLVEEYDIKPEDVEEVWGGTNRGVYEQLIYTEPQSDIEARFSMQFVLAIILLERKGGLTRFTNEKVTDPKTVQLMKKIHRYEDPELSRTLPLAWVDKTATVKVRLKDGRELTRTADIRHLTWDEVKEKYTECASVALPKNKVAESMNLLEHLDTVNDMETVMAIVRKD